jgi:hypothetical protein
VGRRATDLLRQAILDRAMPRDGRVFTAGHVAIDGVFSAFPDETTSVGFQVADEERPFHLVMCRGSRMTERPPISCSAASRLASRINATASARFSRASSRVSPCVFAPGNSSTKAMYPPSSAGWNTAVNVIVCAMERKHSKGPEDSKKPGRCGGGTGAFWRIARNWTAGGQRWRVPSFLGEPRGEARVMRVGPIEFDEVVIADFEFRAPAGERLRKHKHRPGLPRLRRRPRGHLVWTPSGGKARKCHARPDPTNSCTSLAQSLTPPRKFLDRSPNCGS